MRLKLAIALAGAAVVWIFAGAVSAQAQDTAEYDPYGADPLGLIALYEVSSYYTSQISVDRWGVWVCEMAGGTADFQPEHFVEKFTAEISPFFEWLSQGKYRPTFVVGGTVTTAHPPSIEGSNDCQDSVIESSNQPLASGDRAAHAALIIANSDVGESEPCGWAIPWALEPHTTFDAQETPTSRSVYIRSNGLFPDNDRLVFIYGDAPTPDTTCFTTSITAHEIGHQLGWPHSFSGKSILGHDPDNEDNVWINEYDDWNDFMSGALSAEAFEGSVTHIGTSAINRYAAGWIDTAEVAIHPSGPASRTYDLAALSVVSPKPTIQMLVLPSAKNPGVFDVLSVRIRSGFDAGLPDEGVERYRIDQRPTACMSAWPNWNPTVWNPTCHLANRRTIPVPYDVEKRGFRLKDGGILNLHGSSSHVYQPGESFEIEGTTVTIDERQDDTYTVTVTSGCSYIITGVVGPGSWFCDDDGSVHEAAIESLAEAGVTLACDTESYQFCPKDPVTRAQMAAFLVRALNFVSGSKLELSLGAGTFSDVADDAWYASYVNQLVSLGVTQGYSDGTFRPDTLVTREQMATFFTRAFADVQPGNGADPSFADVAAGSIHAAAIEGVFDAGITKGCFTKPSHGLKPMHYCPQQPITRDQMASFLARALKLIPT